MTDAKTTATVARRKAKNGKPLNGSDMAALTKQVIPRDHTDDLRKWKAKRAELEVRRLEGELVDRAELHDGMNRIITVLRTAAERLQRKFGPGAYKILEGALDQCERELDKMIEDKAE